jgi:hypothetical protein
LIIYTSYFYQVRFFPPNLIPISTAAWDPKWFHDGKGHSFQFKDKRGVINGIRADIFAPGPDLGGYCSKSCGQVPPTCDFLLRYRAQLEQLDFRTIWQKFERLAQAIQSREGLENVNFALLLHEAPDNPCSERVAIQQWFNSHGYQVQEWSKPSI